MPVKYTLARIFRRKSFAEAYKKKLERQGYKARLLDEKLRDGSHQYVVYRSRTKGGKG